MAPEDAPVVGRDSDHARSIPDTGAAEAALKAKLSRKRTKTGCLTCRKRRIKCGEERPVCKNCVKSKRQCEGYNQRVVFKPPTFEYQPVANNGGAHITFQAGPVPGQSMPQPDIQTPLPGMSPYGPLRPRAPPDRPYMTVFDTPSQLFVNVEHPHPPLHVQSYPTSIGGVSPEQPDFFQHGFQPDNPVRSMQMPQHFSPDSRVSGLAPPTAVQPGAPMSTPLGPYREPIVGSSGQAMPPVTVSTDHVRQAYGQPTAYGQHPFSPDHLSHSQTSRHPQSWADVKPATGVGHEHFQAPPASSHSSSTLSFSQTPTLATQHQWTLSSYAPRPELSRPIDYLHHHPGEIESAIPAQHMEREAFASHSDRRTPEYYEHEFHAPPHATPTATLNAAAVETVDDDYYDVDSDQEMDFDAQAGERSGHTRQFALNRILALNRTNSHDLQMRRYDTFIYEGLLEHYRVEEVASPLKNPATAHVFAHFISATGPSLSIFERHPRSSSILFAQGSVPFSQQGLWTYTMPMAALRNQGLLHAMLAIASLHIARLQNASVTPSMQHYAWALRRIHASVANHQKSRLKVTTIAASLLLGFYEIMTADHMKWNMHLAGSKQLFVETDFVKMTSGFCRMKAERASRFQPGCQRSEEPFSQDDLLDQIPDVDEALISHLAGQEVRYDNHGCVDAPQTTIPPGLDLSKFEILKDLYWWYCKQDVYQSIVSGNPLLMDYDRWANCPPRAPVGRGDAVYGSFDHLILLLGRIADFVSKDRVRKLKQMQANGGQWRPAPGMNLPRPPQPQAPSTPISATNGFSMQNHFISTPMPVQSPVEAPGNDAPQFFGMAPPPRGNVQMPSSYNPHHAMPTPQSAHPAHHLDFDLHTATDKALEEYGRIRTALQTFRTSLGAPFEPLTSEYQPPMNTSFGTARFYRSYDIGCMWAVYNMAEIIAIRAHPHMPPAAHHAAGVAAQQTAPYAQEIGRIAAGIAPGPADQPLNPTLGAALCESCVPSFFAAVQFQDPHQRHETVTRIFSIAKRTGWGSAELIANGMETAWVKAAAAGRGPPYQRIARPQEYNEDPRLNGSWEYLDPNAQPEENNESDRRLIRMKKEARLNWAIGVMGVEEDVRKIKISD